MYCIDENKSVLWNSPQLIVPWEPYDAKQGLSAKILLLAGYLLAPHHQSPTFYSVVHLSSRVAFLASIISLSSARLCWVHRATYRISRLKPLATDALFV